jgi:hypothetical protein
VAIGLACAAIVQGRALGWVGWVAGAVLVTLTVWAGWWEAPIGMWAGLGLALVALAGFVAAALLMRRAEGNAPGPGLRLSAAWRSGWCSSGRRCSRTAAALIGTYGQYPFRAAYADYQGQTLMSSKIQAQRWLLERTDATESVGIWTDPDRLMASVAGMQLWGWYNNIPAGRPSTGTECDALRSGWHRTPSPCTHPNGGQIEDFDASLPPWSMPTPLECTTVPYLGVGDDQPSICLTHLTWLR